MLQLDSITLRFGDETLFDNISTLVNIGERIGLVGPNGAGKTTLLKIIAGDLEPDEGTVVLSSGESVGYLPQDGVDPDPKLTVYEEVESAFHEILSLQEELQTIREKMEKLPADSSEYQKALKAFGRKQDQLENSRAYTLKSDIERILMGLGFNEEDFARSTTEFSGGWLMRIALAKLLLRTPAYLLLDEPTNHLDIESLQWIERFLKNYDGAVIVVSHDRAFLDSLTHRTLALRNGDMHDYAGNYSFFEKKYEEEMEQLRKEYQNQQKELKQTQEFIDRFRYKASKAKQVQSRVKQLEKMELIELEDEQDEISFRFPQPERSGQIVIRLENLNKSYGEHTVFSGIDYEVERGDKIAVVGPNGAGKSTLIRIIAGLEPYDDGKRIPGHNVTPSYFAQHQSDELNTENNALEEIRTTAPRESETRLRTLLGCFLFSGDDVFKKISVLSGGEKSRLALAKMLIRPANFIILDEPTNHLDMQSKKILQEALNQFEGTCMIVSHDRDFLDPVVNKTLEAQPDSIKTWMGNVSYYLDRKAEQEEEKEIQNSDERSSGQNEKLSRKEERRIEAQIRNEKSRKTKPLKKKLDATEEKIRVMEKRISEIEENMAESDFYDDSDKVKEISLEYDKLKNDLNESLTKWEELAGRIEYIEQEVEERAGYGL